MDKITNERLRAVAETARRDGQEISAGLHERILELRADLLAARQRITQLEQLKNAVETFVAAKDKYEAWRNEYDSAYNAVIEGDYSAPNLSDLQQEVNHAEEAVDAAVGALLEKHKETQ